MDGLHTSALHETGQDDHDDTSTAASFVIRDPNTTPTSTPKRQRMSNSPVQLTSSPSSQSPPYTDNAVIRMILRSCTYFIYDGFSIAGGRKECARIVKAIVELCVDETYPPPHRSDMSICRKCTEFLVAPAASSLAWFIVRIFKASRQKRLPKEKAKTATLVWIKALWAVIHRVCRQALIYRLFFRMGSLRYSLTSALGIICCFFKDSLFPDFLQLRKWPLHFSPSQGLAALFRSAVYSFSFSLPVQKLSKPLQDSARRRGNVKKLIFAVILSQLQSLRGLEKLLSTNQSWTV